MPAARGSPSLGLSPSESCSRVKLYFVVKLFSSDDSCNWLTKFNLSVRIHVAGLKLPPFWCATTKTGATSIWRLGWCVGNSTIQSKIPENGISKIGEQRRRGKGGIKRKKKKKEQPCTFKSSFVPSSTIPFCWSNNRLSG